MTLTRSSILIFIIVSLFCRKTNFKKEKDRYSMKSNKKLDVWNISFSCNLRICVTEFSHFCNCIAEY